MANKVKDLINQYQDYTRKNVSASDPTIQKILSDPKNNIQGSVSYADPKNNTINTYTPEYTEQPQSPSYTQPYRDIAAEMDLAASMGEWDKFSSLANERMQKVAQNGGNDGGVTTNDLVNQLRAKYSKGYNNYMQQQNITKLLGDVSSPYDSLYQSLLQKYNNYNFDTFKNSSAYQGLKSLYEMSGQNAMKDTLGEIAARTGGYASSYATAAAQEQYQNYMAQLASLAQQMYSGEKNSMQNDLQMLGNRADNYIEQQRANNINVYNALRQLQQDQKAEEDAENQKVATAQQYARDAIINALSNGVDMELLDQGLLEQSGLSYMDLLAYAKIYSDKSAQQQFENDLKTSNNELNWAKYGLSASKAGRSSGGGGGSRKSTGGNLTPDASSSKWSAVEEYETKYGEDAVNDFIKANRKKLGLGSSDSAAISGYKVYKQEKATEKKISNVSKPTDDQSTLIYIKSLLNKGATKEQLKAEYEGLLKDGQITQSEYKQILNLLARAV